MVFFFIARKAYHVTASATFQNDSCNNAIGYYFKETGGELFKWYDLSGYREIDGIKLPSLIVEDGAIKKQVRYEINPQYDPQVFERPPNLAAGPQQWRLKKAQ